MLLVDAAQGHCHLVFYVCKAHVLPCVHHVSDGVSLHDESVVESPRASRIHL